MAEHFETVLYRITIFCAVSYHFHRFFVIEMGMNFLGSSLVFRTFSGDYLGNNSGCQTVKNG